MQCDHGSKNNIVRGDDVCSVHELCNLNVLLSVPNHVSDHVSDHTVRGSLVLCGNVVYVPHVPLPTLPH